MYKRLFKYLPQLLLVVIITLHTKFAVAFFWVVFHEFMHFIVSYKLNIKKEKAGIHALGAYLYLKDLDYISPNQDIIISFAGPLSNLLLAIFFYFSFKHFNNEFLMLSFESNLALAFFNLLPAFPLDGSRILRAFLSKKKLYKKAYMITINCSFIISAFLFSGFIFLLFFNRINISLGLASILTFFVTVKEKERIMYIIMGDIVKKRNRFIKQKYIENKSISIHVSLSLVNVLGIIDKNKYNVFTILNDEMMVLGVLYEEDIIYGAKEYGNISIEELMTKEEFVHKFTNL